MKGETAVPEEDLTYLLANTEFVKKDIERYYKFGTFVDKDKFKSICDESKLVNGDLQDRLWDVFDANDDGNVSVRELVEMLSKLLRGTLEDLTVVFFKIYDINKDNALSMDELLEVYAVLLSVTSEGPAELTEKDKLCLKDFFAENDTDGDGAISPAEFAAAVRKISESTKEPIKFLTFRNIWLTFVVSLFEIGTSVSLPAMGALSTRIQDRYDVGKAGVGELVAYYYLGSCVGPLFGGYLLSKYGPGRTIIVANCIVLFGAVLQAFSDGNDQFNLLIFARVVIGFGGLITPFTTIEVLGKLFPDHFMAQVGFRNLIQSGSGFLAFILLPSIADSYGDIGPEDATRTPEQEDAYNTGTGRALWFCAACVLTSICANIYIYVFYLRVMKENAEKSAELAKHIRGFAMAITPKAPGKWAQWKLPLSLYISLYAIQAQYFAPFAFTAFSNEIYENKFGFSAANASFLSGVMNLIGGFVGPIAGPASDYLGFRALSLAGFGCLNVIGFTLLAATTVNPWVATILFSLAFGWGDTVAYPNIALLAGDDRAAVGYAIFGLVGGAVMWVVPFAAGELVTDDGNRISWYFAALSGFAALSWYVVHLLEGKRSPIELPASQLIVTEDNDIQAAALMGIHKTTSDAIEISSKSIKPGDATL